MEATLNLTQENSARVEISNFLNEGIQDMKNGKVVSFDEVFNELEKGYDAND